MNPRSKYAVVAAVTLLIALHVMLALSASTDKGMTSDEIAHLVAGQAYNTRGDFRLQPENGNLPQRLAAIPMTLAQVRLPPTALDSWQEANVWRYGHTYFYEQGLVTDEWLLLGRAMISLVSAATALLVFLWSRELFGQRGGFVSLALFVFSPTFLAHGALATSDVVMTFFFVASVGAWWRHLERPGAVWAATSAVTLGVAFVAKFSAVLLPPMLGLIGVVWIVGEIRRGGSWRKPLLRLVRSGLVHGAVAWFVIWLFYGFRFSAFAPELMAGATFNHGWGWTLTGMGFPGKIISALKEWRVLPEAWLYGLSFVLQFSRARGAFMSGDYSVTGWAAFFPFAFLIKTTLPLLLLLTAGTITVIITAMRHRVRHGLGSVAARLRPLTPLAVLFLVYWATSITSHLNIGHRHILPTYPVLFIAAGWLGKWLDWRRPLIALLIGGAVTWHAGEALGARPNYLAYFNQIIGGPANGWRHLVDSSLDWGQDLPGLKRWLDANGRKDPVYLSYFGTGDPSYEGITATMMPRLPDVRPPGTWHHLSPGIYVISVTMLQHVYSAIRGAWTVELESEFQKLRAIEPTLLAYQNDPERRIVLQRDAPAGNWVAAWKRYEQLRFARLCHFLRARDADATIGHSIRIYRLNAGDLDSAVGGSIEQWRHLIESAVARRQHSGSAN